MIFTKSKTSTLAAIAAFASALLVNAEEQSATAPEDSLVVKLDSDSFQPFLEANDLLLAEFFAPWCGHCKTLAPHYVEAAKILHEEFEIPIAQIDCTENQDLCMEQGIKGYPSLKVFKKNGEVVTEYQGQRTKDAIVQFMKKQALPAVSQFTNTTALNDFLEKQQENVVVAQYNAVDGALNDTFFNVAELLRDDYVFVNFQDGEGSGNVSVISGKQAPTAFTADLTDLSDDEANTQFSEFIVVESMPFFGEIDGSTYEKYMSAQIPLVYYFYLSDEQRKEFEPFFNKLGEQYRGKLNFAGLDASKYGKHAENLNMKEQFPLIAIHEIETNMKYGTEQLPEDEFDVEETKITLAPAQIEEFVASYLAGDLSPILKSEDVPTVQESNVTKIVGTTHDEIRYDTAKDVLVEYYAPWCGHCKKLAPLYDTLADIYALDENASSKVVIGKIDGTLNDVFGIEIGGYPTLALYPAGDLTKEPIIYKGSRTLDGFLDFIKKSGSHGIDGAQIIKDNTPVEEEVEDDEEVEDNEEVEVEDEEAVAEDEVVVDEDDDEEIPEQDEL